MARTKTLVASVVTGLLFAGTACAEDPRTNGTHTVIQPVPQSEFTNVVRARHIKPGDVSPEEYAALLAEAERVKAYQSSQGTSGATVIYDGSYQNAQATPIYSSTNYVATQTPTYSDTPSRTVYTAPRIPTRQSASSRRVELYDTPINSSVTYATSQSTPSSMSTSYSSPEFGHNVAKGDTLYNISKRYGVTLSALRNANAISGSNIQLGQRLTIPSTERTMVTQTQNNTAAARATLVRNVQPVPSSSVYAVLPQDTLFSISRFACVDVNELATLNGITNGSNLLAGQRLTMPSGHCLR